VEILAMINLVSVVLKNGMDILGVSLPNKMWWTKF
jgi:arginyl-tRNA synthetase